MLSYGKIIRPMKVLISKKECELVLYTYHVNEDRFAKICNACVNYMGMTLVLDNDCTVVNGSSYRFLVDINTDREIELL